MKDQNQVVQLVEESGLEKSTAQELKESFNPFFEQASEWKDKASKIVVKDASEIELMKQAREARLQLKNIRIEADKTRKALKEDSVRYGKAVQGVYNVIEYLIVPIEKHLEQQEKFIEIQEAQKKQELKQKRESELIPFQEFVPSNLDLENMSDEDFNKILNGAYSQMKAKEKADKEAEEERIKQEKIIKQRNEREKVLLSIIGVKRNDNNTFTLKNLENEDFSNMIDVKEILDCDEKRFNGYLQEFKTTEENNELFLKEQKEENERLKKERQEAELKAEKDKKERMTKAEKFLLDNGFEKQEHGFTAKKYNHFIGSNHYSELETDNELLLFKNGIIQTKEKLEREASEKKAKEEADRKAKEEAEQKEKAPDKKKILEYIKCIQEVPEPILKSDKASELLESYAFEIDKLLNELRGKANNL